MNLSCFKDYDTRGKLGEELNEEIARRIGRAYGEFLKPRRVVIGSDVRLTSDPLKLALADGLVDAGVDVIDIGLAGTEEVYFAAFHLDVDGGIEVTSSHNPTDYNGMKLVRRGAQPLSGDSGLREIRYLAEAGDFPPPAKRGYMLRQSIFAPYVEHLLGYIDASKLKPIKLVVNAGNGAAGHVIDAVEACFKVMAVPVEFIKVHHEPGSSFPNGIPNPLSPENCAATVEAAIKYKTDMGIAWDGDFDNCFLFDENGKFIEGYYIVGLLATAFLADKRGERIIHDPRLTWNTIDIVNGAGGIPIQSKTGHAFIKERMRAENAIYGGEMSAHHYFRDFAYCDSGMVPWLLVIELMSVTGKTLSNLVDDREASYSCSGEINYRVEDANAAIARVEEHFALLSPSVDRTDGIGLAFPEWRPNLRSSNTDPLLRLNIETRFDAKLLVRQLQQPDELIVNH